MCDFFFVCVCVCVRVHLASSLTCVFNCESSMICSKNTTLIFSTSHARNAILLFEVDVRCRRAVGEHLPDGGRHINTEEVSLQIPCGLGVLDRHRRPHPVLLREVPMDSIARFEYLSVLYTFIYCILLPSLS